MSLDCRARFLVYRGLAVHIVPVLVGVTLLLVGCSGGGESGSIAPQAERNPQLEQQAVQSLLDLYRTAVLQEDIDRLQALVDGEGGTFEGTSFLEAMSDLFRRLSVIDLQITEVAVQGAPAPLILTFQEVLAVVDPAQLEQRTVASRIRWHLSLRGEASGTVTPLIARVVREGPRFQVTTRGQMVAGLPVRVELTETTGAFPIAGSVVVEVPETGAVQALAAAGNRFHGIVTPPASLHPQPLRIGIQGPGGEAVTLHHRYRLRVPGEGVVERIVGTETTRLFAVAIAQDGSVWAGGDSGASLFQMTPGTSAARRVGRLLDDPTGRVEDIVIDALGRIHTLVFSAERSGDIVLDQARFCQTVNVLDPLYPFRVQDVQTGALRPSPSTRALAATGGDIWLFGSDGGVARVADAFRNGHCPRDGVAVRYDPIFHREDGGLLSNTVPAFVLGADGSLSFGTAVGLQRLQGQQFTPVLFDSGSSVRGDVKTLEAFFREVAQVIFAARPLTTVRLGNVSFLEQFGRPLVKDDLIFSLVEDRQARLWVGTLGGGMRRIEAGKQTRHLTRRDGLISNIVFTLTEGPEETIWAVTEEGVSRIRERDGAPSIINFSPLDGLATPVRDVAVDGLGTVWLATDRGLFRLVERGGRVAGVVLDNLGRPVGGADIIIPDTPFRAVTDAKGRFELANLPLGPQRLQVDGALAMGGPFTSVVRHVTVTGGRQTLGDVMLPVGSAGPLSLVLVSGDGQTGRADTPLALPLVVAVRDTRANPVSGIPVTFTVVEGRGSLSPALVTTAADGQAATTLTVGAIIGPMRVEAAAEGQVVVFTAAPPASLSSGRLIEVAGNRQIAAPGQVLPEPLAVRLEDQFGKPLEGREIRAEIVQGEAELLTPTAPAPGDPPPGQMEAVTALTQRTDARGEAAFRLRAGTREGTIVVAVSAPELPATEPVEFIAIVAFLVPRAIAVEANGSLVVVDERLQGVARLDPGSGASVVVSDAHTGGGPPLRAPVGIAIAADGRLLVLDSVLGTLVQVDRRSGDRTVLSGDGSGSGPALVLPVGIALEADGHLLVADTGRASIVRIDPENGDRFVLSGEGRGRGPPFVTLTAIAVDADGSLLVVDSVLEGVVRVDAVTGDRTMVSDPQTGRGPAFRVPVGITIEASGRLVMVDGAAGLKAVVRVDPRSGDRTVVSDAGTGNGPSLADPVGIVVHADGHLLVVDAELPGVLRVDPVSGDRTLISRRPRGSGLAFLEPLNIALEADGHLVVIDVRRAAVVRVDPASGDRTIVSDANTGVGRPFKAPSGIAVEANGRLVMVDGVVVVRVDPVSGDRSVVSDASTGSGPALLNPKDVAVETNGHLVVLDDPARRRAIIRVDPVSGDRSVVSDPIAGTGRGPFFLLPAGIAVEADGHLVVVDNQPAAVVRVDPVSGDRSVVSDASTGRGPTFGFLLGLAVEAKGHLVVTDSRLRAVVRVDPLSGDRSVVSDATIGRGPTFGLPEDIAVEANGHLVVVDAGLGAVVRVDPVSGDRTLVSQ